MKHLPYKVIITCTETRGKCDLGHKVGDVIEFEDWEAKGFMCPTTYAAFYPIIRTMAFGGDEDKRIACCPDPLNLVVFELRREKSTKSK